MRKRSLGNSGLEIAPLAFGGNVFGWTVDETLQAHAQLLEQGKVRAIGASDYSAERLSYALALSRRHGLPRYGCLQTEYNLYDRVEYEQTLEPVCIENGLGVLSYFSLASG